MEKHEYREFNDKTYNDVYELNNITIDRFYGDVLFVGMGDLYFPINVDVNSITIIEKYDKPINKYKDITMDFNVIKADAFDFETTYKYDVIFLDIWYHVEDINVVNNLIRKYSNYLKDDGKLLYLDTIINPIRMG